MMMLRGMVEIFFGGAVFSQTNAEVSLQVWSGWILCVASYSASQSCVVG